MLFLSPPTFDHLNCSACRLCLQMVDLTAKNMSSTNSKNRKEWGEELKKVFQGEDEAFAVGYGYCYYCWCHCLILI